MIVGTLAAMAAAKGTSSCRAKRSLRAVKARQIDVGIDGRVAVAGEMFGAGQNAFGREAAKEGNAHARDLLRVGAEAAAGGDRARGIGRQIEHGSEIEVDARGAQLASHGARHLLDEGDVVERAEFGWERARP